MDSEKELNKKQNSATNDSTQRSSANVKSVNTLHEDLDCIHSDEEDEEEQSLVVFNGDLRCEHGL